MPLNISSYVDPGVYVGEQVIPNSVSLSTVPLTVTLVGIANRNKRVSNEAVTRGLVTSETLTVASTSGAHNATLANISNRKTAQTTVYKDGVALDSTDVTYLSATVTGGTLTTLDFTTNNELALALDGLKAVTIAVTSGAGYSTTVTNDLITQQMDSGAVTIGALTAANIADAINRALGGASTLGYGSAYGGVASAAANKVTLTSPLSSSASDVRLYAAFPSAKSQTAAVFGVSLPFQAASVVQIPNTDYSGTSVYKADYVSTNHNTDTLANTNVQDVIRAGNFAGVSGYIEGTDFNLSSNSLDWSIATAATFTGSIAAATFDISTNDTIILSFDGKAAVTVDLNGLASPPPGYANPVSAAAATLAEINNNINAVIANSTTYGPAYASVASTGSSKLILTSPTTGAGSIVEIGAPATLSAVTALYGLSAGQLPHDTFGVGSKPSAGSIYFVTYEYTRPASDYNTPKRYFAPNTLYADIGYPTATNQLAIAGGLAFDNKAPSVIVCQVNDANFPGSPTQSEIQAAIDGTDTTASATDIVVLDTRVGVQSYLVNDIVNQSSATQKNYRRGWFGMPAGTAIGDKDTADTYIYRATRTLQVPGDSPGRGRLILVAPPSATRTITKEDGSEQDVTLDSTYTAAAIAALMTSFSSPSDTLLRKTLSGLNVDTFPTYLKTERALLASNGVTVVTSDTGALVLTDPMTTEGGGGNLVTFKEISASTQKDAVTLAVSDTVDANLVGVVPSDLSSFILNVKALVAGALNSLIATGAIAPFKTADGVTRDIDLSQDIQVFQSVTDPTAYNFNYFFNLRLPAKRFFGQYSTNASFF